jgi:MFS transporter, SP family, sugar:H+ symporter
MSQGPHGLQSLSVCHENYVLSKSHQRVLNNLLGIFVAFGGILFGYDTGTISGIIAMPFWLERFSKGYTNADGEPALNPSDESLIVSILSLGTFLGALTAAPCADYFGRRMGLILSTAIVFNLGVLLQTIATDQPLFIAGRFFAGYGVGLISAQSKLKSFLLPAGVHACIQTW